MLKKETTTLGHTATFCSSHTMHSFDKHDVLINVFLTNQLHIFLMMVLKEQPHLHKVASNCSLSKVAYLQGNVQLV